MHFVFLCRKREICISLIKNTIFQITQKEEATIDMIVAKLVSLIDKKVLDIHQRYISKSNRTTLKNIAKSEHIEFNDTSGEQHGHRND